MKFSLTILGSSSATPTVNRHHSSFILNFGSAKYMIDCGEGTQNRCLQYDINYQRIDSIFISHMHGDHILGLFGLINTMNLYSRKKKLTVYSVHGLRDLFETYSNLSDIHLHFELEFVELPVEPHVCLQTTEVRVSVFPVFHRIPCLAFRFEEIITKRKLNADVCYEYNVPVSQFASICQGEDYVTENGKVIKNSLLTFDPDKPRVYVHVTDTLFNENVAGFAKSADLLYHEATFLDNLKERAFDTFHSTALQAAQIARIAGVEKLLIGHFSSRYKDLSHHLDEAKSVFQESYLAVEGQTVYIR